MSELRLSWHAGSILPYASLWHTVLRACALNALHPRDLPSSRARPPARVELLENDSGRVDVTAFAHALGETPAAFQWSTLGSLPAWLRGALTVPRPRLCLSCLADGYHSALFSISLLDVCPIHGTPLIDHCHCSAPFHTTLHSLSDFATAGSCRCGRLHFFTHETCRRPTLPAHRAQSLSPLAAWLDAMSGLIRPQNLDTALRQRVSGGPEWVASVARVLGIEYPASLRPLAAPAVHVETVCYRAHSRTAPRCDCRAPRGTRHDENPTYCRATHVTTICGAVARHVRRHYAPNSLRWAARFMRSCDPLVIGEMLRCRDQARRAFTTMLWTRAIGLGIGQRRWQERTPSTDTWRHLDRFIEASSLVCGAECNDAELRHWLTCHAVRASLSGVWQKAEACVTAIARSGIAAWDDSPPDTSWCDSAWLARVTPGGVLFASPSTAPRPSAARATKVLRQAAYVAGQQARRQTLLASCCGACLTWSPESGWDVMESIVPADYDLRRRRLLGQEDGRAWFWLYQTGDGRFVARWENARLQVLAATPRAAIIALRRGASEYQRICRTALPVAARAPILTSCPTEARITAEYDQIVAVARYTDGFWRDASKLVAAARRYQSARAFASHSEGTTAAEGSGAYLRTGHDSYNFS